MAASMDLSPHCARHLPPKSLYTRKQSSEMRSQGGDQPSNSRTTHVATLLTATNGGHPSSLDPCRGPLVQ